MKPEEMQHGEWYEIVSTLGNKYELEFDRIDGGHIHKNKAILTHSSYKSDIGKRFSAGWIINLSQVKSIKHIPNYGIKWLGPKESINYQIF